MQDLSSPAALQEALRNAWLAVQEQRWRDAERLFRPIMSTRAASAGIWVLYASVALRRADTASAVSRLHTALALAPSESLAVSEFARVAAVGRDSELAEHWTRRATLLRPLDPATHVVRAHALGLEKLRSPRARTAARRAVMLEPASADGTLSLAMVESNLAPWSEQVPYPERLALCSGSLPRAVDMLVQHYLKRGDGAAAQEWFARSRPGAEERLAAALVEPGAAVLDIGAHLGFTALGFLRAGAGRVHSVEANPELARRLTAVLPDTVSVHPVALSDSEGETTLTMPTGRPGSASIDPSFNAANVAGSPGGGLRFAVPTCPLDALDIERCSFWKLDVEGVEIQVLRGAERTLRDRPPDWLLAEVFGEPLRPPEHLEAFSDLLREVLPHRYEVIATSGGGLHLRALPRGAPRTAPADRGTSTPLYLYAARPAPEAIP